MKLDIAIERNLYIKYLHKPTRQQAGLYAIWSIGDIHWCVHRHMDEGATETHSYNHTWSLNCRLLHNTNSRKYIHSTFCENKSTVTSDIVINVIIISNLTTLK